MKLFIAEKPDLARDIVRCLDEKFTQKDGYYESNNYWVTWCYGHILESVGPEEYNPNYAKWNIEDLPLKLYPVKLKPKKTASKQVKIIIDLIKKADSIVNAGDPDDEGQLLVDEILIYCNNKKNVERLLISDPTDEAIKNALHSMKSNSLYKGLYLKALARSVSDSIYGLSMTRAITILNGNKNTLSIGRVQTPILAMIVKRYLENKNHKKSFYYVINGTFDNFKGYWQPADDVPVDEKKRLINKDYAQSIVNKVKSKKGIVVNKSLDNKEISPPLPYNLAKLQQDMNNKYGYSAETTLNLTQQLREKYKAITYNRSDCSYLSDEQYKNAPDLISKLKTLNNYGSIDFDSNIKSSAFNSSKITAHTAIIPTLNIPNIGELSSDEKNVYTAIVERFLCQFLPNKKYLSLIITINVENETFILKENKITDSGFTLFLKTDNDEEIQNTESFDLLNKLVLNDSILCKDSSIEEKETKPRPLFTEASLLSALVRVADYVEDPRIKQLLKDKDKDKKDEHGGIGTPATRHLMFENLKKRGFITLNKNNLVPTELGLAFCNSLPEKVLAPDLTALLSEQQDFIQSGKLSMNDFVNSLYSDISDLLKSMNANSISQLSSSSEDKCPFCSSSLQFSPKVVKCSNIKCGLIVFKNIAKKDLTDSQIQELLTKRVTKLIKGFKSKNGKDFNARLSLEDDKKVIFLFDNSNK